MILVFIMCLLNHIRILIDVHWISIGLTCYLYLCSMFLNKLYWNDNGFISDSYWISIGILMNLYWKSIGAHCFVYEVDWTYMRCLLISIGTLMELYLISIGCHCVLISHIGITLDFYLHYVSFHCCYRRAVLNSRMLSGSLQRKFKGLNNLKFAMTTKNCVSEVCFLGFVQTEVGNRHAILGSVRL